MEQEIIAIAQKPDTLDINGQIAITKLLEMGASWMGMVACWWATMLMQGGIFFTTVERKDCSFVIVIFLFICFRHRLYFCPQATWSLTEASRSLWTNNIQQLALSIGCISRLFYWCKIFSAISCAVLSLIQLISQDFGQTEVANMATRNFALNVFYMLTLIEAVLLLLAFILSMLFERAKKENKEHKEEEKDDENEAEHETIDILDQTNTCIQQQDSSNPMLNNNGEGTSHTITGKEAPKKFFCKENTRSRRKNHTAVHRRLHLKLQEWLAIPLGTMVLSSAKMLWEDDMFTLETKDLMFATVILLLVCIRLSNSSLQVARRSYMLGNNIQQHISGHFYWFQLVSALICVVLSMMGFSRCSGQTEVTKRVSQKLNLSIFYCLTFLEALSSMLLTFINRPTGQQTDRSNNILPKYLNILDGRMELTKASEHPVAFIPERENCKNVEKKAK